MTLTKETILRRVDEGENAMGPYRRRAERWESMWRLEAFRETPEMAIKDGRELVTLPEPYNVVALAMRLLSDEPSIEVPSEEVEEGKDQAAENRLRFLKALWRKSNRDRRTNIIKDAVWQGLVRGRFVFEVKWIREKLPKRLRDRRLPMLIRTLDPMNVYVRDGSMGVMWAYHKYLEAADQVAARYPDVKAKLEDRYEETDEVPVIDFWWIDENTGDVWNAVLVEDEEVIPGRKTDYPDIPIVIGYNDSAPVGDETNRGMSILHPLNGLWHYRCRLASQMATGLLWYFWPAIVVQNEKGLEVPDIDITPGTTTPLPPGTRVDVIQADPNVPLAQTVEANMAAQIQQSTFPSVMYGEAPGNISAGYGVQILADAARGRINSLRENMEWAMETVNEIALALVEQFAGPEGVKIWGVDEALDGIYHVVIRPSDISGYYENYVRLVPNVPNEDLQRQTLGLRLVEGQIISRRTFRQKYAGVALPSDEEERVLVEEAIMDPQVRQRALQEALRRYYGDNAPLPQQQQQQAQPTGPGAPPQPPPAPTEAPPPPVQPPMPPGDMAGLPDDFQAPGMDGVPGPAIGQITPEMMGNIDPASFQILMGEGPPTPLPDEEEMRRMGLLPPMP